MAAKPIVLWGATGQAIVLAEFLPAVGYTICGLFDNADHLLSPFPDVELVGGMTAFPAWREQQPEQLCGLVAIGGDKGKARLQISDFLRLHRIVLPAVQHPTAYVAHDAFVAEGAQILAGAIIGARARIGRAAIINTRAGVDHECSISAGAHIGPGASLAGAVVVGEGAFIGTGASILPHMKIGAHAVVGAGSVVTRDIPAGAVAYGNPARIYRYINGSQQS